MVLLVAALKGTTALAGACINDGPVGDLPGVDVVDVPLNAQPSFLRHVDIGPIPLRLTVADVGVPGREVETAFGDSRLYEFVPDLPLLPSTTYTIHYELLGNSSSHDFTTGTTTDVEPPRFETVDVTSERGRPCGRLRRHQLSASGDLQEFAPDAYYTIAVPVDPSHEPIVGQPTAVAVWRDACEGNDETLLDTFHRTYDVTFLDIAGNRTPPVRVATQGTGVSYSWTGEELGSTGCSAAPTPFHLSTMLLVRRR